MNLCCTEYDPMDTSQKSTVHQILASFLPRHLYASKNSIQEWRGNFISPYLSYVHRGGRHKPNIANRGRILIQQQMKFFLVDAIPQNALQNSKALSNAHPHSVPKHILNLDLDVLTGCMNLIFKQAYAFS